MPGHTFVTFRLVPLQRYHYSIVVTLPDLPLIVRTFPCILPGRFHSDTRWACCAIYPFMIPLQVYYCWLFILVIYCY